MKMRPQRRPVSRVLDSHPATQTYSRIDERYLPMRRLGILLSGRGSNFLAIHRAIHEQRLLGAKIAVVLSNREDAPGLVSAKELDLPAFCIPSAGRNRADHDAEM